MHNREGDLLGMIHDLQPVGLVHKGRSLPACPVTLAGSVLWKGAACFLNESQPADTQHILDLKGLILVALKAHDRVVAWSWMVGDWTLCKYLTNKTAAACGGRWQQSQQPFPSQRKL